MTWFPLRNAWVFVALKYIVITLCSPGGLGTRYKLYFRFFLIDWRSERTSPCLGTSNLISGLRRRRWREDGGHLRRLGQNVVSHLCSHSPRYIHPTSTSRQLLISASTSLTRTHEPLESRGCSFLKQVVWGCSGCLIRPVSSNGALSPGTTGGLVEDYRARVRQGLCHWRKRGWRNKGADSLVTRCGGRRALRKYGENREDRGLELPPTPPHHPLRCLILSQGTILLVSTTAKQITHTHPTPKLWLQTTIILLSFLVSACRELGNGSSKQFLCEMSGTVTVRQWLELEQWGAGAARTWLSISLSLSLYRSLRASPHGPSTWANLGFLKVWRLQSSQSAPTEGQDCVS